MSEFSCKQCTKTITGRTRSMICRSCSIKNRHLARKTSADTSKINKQKSYRSAKPLNSSEISYDKALESGISMHLTPAAQYANTMLNVMKAMGFSVISIADRVGKKAIVFADKYNTVKLVEISQNINIIEEVVPLHQPISSLPDKVINHPDIENILRASKYKAVRNIEWQEYDDKISAFVNVSWQRKKSMRVAIPALFAGALLVDDHQALYITCIEAYCRSLSIDAHYERYHGAESNQSHPEEIQYSKPSIYNDVCIKITWDHNTPQIKIGLRTANLLVVGCIRVDVEDIASVGLTNDIFKPTNCTRLFFDTKSIHKAEQLVKENKIEISDGYDYARLRQLRSKFDSESTYFMCRTAADGFLPHKSWPVTIWTYADVESRRKKESSSKIASFLFTEVATCVFERKKMSYATVMGIHERMRQTACSAKKDILENIVSLFDCKAEINVLFNGELCSLLTSLAGLMQKDISGENSKRALRLIEAFKKIN